MITTGALGIDDHMQDGKEGGSKGRIGSNL